ncbi:MAG: hypothetical protein ACRERS_08655, partial [Methylococcales bacterium]
SNIGAHREALSSDQIKALSDHLEGLAATCHRFALRVQEISTQEVSKTNLADLHKPSIGSLSKLVSYKRGTSRRPLTTFATVLSGSGALALVAAAIAPKSTLLVGGAALAGLMVSWLFIAFVESPGKGLDPFHSHKNDSDSTGAPPNEASQIGDGAIVQGTGTAVGAHGVQIGGNNNGDINTGTRIDTGGGAYVGGHVKAGRDFIARDKITDRIPSDAFASGFAELLAAVGQQASAENRRAAIEKVQDLKSAMDLGENADDSQVAKIVDALATLAPGAVASIQQLFSAPPLKGWIGPVTRFVLDRWQEKNRAS